jgi:hypothetical protein
LHKGKGVLQVHETGFISFTIPRFLLRQRHISLILNVLSNKTLIFVNNARPLLRIKTSVMFEFVHAPDNDVKDLM